MSSDCSDEDEKETVSSHPQGAGGRAFLITRLRLAQHIWKSCSGVCVTPHTISPGPSESLLKFGSLGDVERF